MFDNQLWGGATGSWGTIVIGPGQPGSIYGPAPPYYPPLAGPPVYGSFGLDGTVVLIGAVLVILLLLK